MSDVQRAQYPGYDDLGAQWLLGAAGEWSRLQRRQYFGYDREFLHHRLYKSQVSS